MKCSKIDIELNNDRIDTFEDIEWDEDSIYGIWLFKEVTYPNIDKKGTVYIFYPMASVRKVECRTVE